MRNDFQSNYLAHHGILGMRWGKRNGPPYPLDSSQKSAAEKRHERISDLSDQELRQRINRLQMEKQYKQMTMSPEEKQISEGKKFVKNVLKGAAMPLAVGSTVALIKAGKVFVPAAITGAKIAYRAARLARYGIGY